MPVYSKVSVADKERLYQALVRGDDYVRLAEILGIKRTTAYHIIGPFEFKVEGRSKTAGTAEGCDFWDQNGVLLLHLRVQQQRKSKINELTMSDVIE